MQLLFSILPYLLCVALGGVAVGVLANRRPEWFAKVVKVANVVDSAVNDGAAKIAAKASPPSTAPPAAPPPKS
jgi:hypothetical protein